MGESNESTAKAAAQLQFCRLQISASASPSASSSSSTSFLGIELKDKVHTLGWDADRRLLADGDSCDSDMPRPPVDVAQELQYCVACEVIKLANDDTVDVHTLRYIIAGAFQDYYNDPRRETGVERTARSAKSAPSEESATDDVEAMIRVLMLAPIVIKRASLILECKFCSRSSSLVSDRNYLQLLAALEKQEPAQPKLPQPPSSPSKGRDSEGVSLGPVVVEMKQPMQSQSPKTPAKSWADALREADAASPYRSGLLKIDSGKSKSKTPTTPKKESAPVALPPAPAPAPSPAPAPAPVPTVKALPKVEVASTGAGTPKKLAERRQSRLSSISDAQYSLPFALDKAEQILARDANGALVVIRLVSADTNGINKSAKTVETPAVESNKADKKAALASLLKFPGSGGGPPAAGAGVGAGSSSSTGGSNKGPALAAGANREAAKRIPAPPPLPQNWPRPEPYTRSQPQDTSSQVASGDRTGLPPLPGIEQMIVAIVSTLLLNLNSSRIKTSRTGCEDQAFRCV
jgi:hypothetical protein